MLARTASAGETQALAAALSSLCGPGDVIVLAGEMGAGKTAFAQGFARGIGVTDPVTSPTFTIVREYQGLDLALHHLDVYRLEQIREVLELGVGEMLDEDAVMLVEWGDAVLPALGEDHLEVRLTFASGPTGEPDAAATAATGADDPDGLDDVRILAVNPKGASWVARRRVLAEVVAPWALDQTGGSGRC